MASLQIRREKLEKKRKSKIIIKNSVMIYNETYLIHVATYRSAKLLSSVPMEIQLQGPPMLVDKTNFG